jgi:hypothetical protein
MFNRTFPIIAKISPVTWMGAVKPKKLICGKISRKESYKKILKQAKVIKILIIITPTFPTRKVVEEGLAFPITSRSLFNLFFLFCFMIYTMLYPKKKKIIIIKILIMIEGSMGIIF